MAEHEPPECVRQVFVGFGERMKELSVSLDDFRDAIDNGGTLDEIINDFEARQMLRQIPPNALAS